jgi:hypothetical protein
MRKFANRSRTIITDRGSFILGVLLTRKHLPTQGWGPPPGKLSHFEAQACASA